MFIALLAGGNWNNASNGVGSRCRNANNVRSNVNENISGRGSIREKSILTPKKEHSSSLLTAEHVTLAINLSQNTKRRRTGSGSFCEGSSS